MNHLQKSYRPDPHAQYLLQLLALPTALVLIAAIRYVLKIVPAGIVNLICSLLLLAALLGIFILLPFWFRNTRYIITEQDIISISGIFIRREKRMRLRALQCSTIVQTPFCKYTGMTFLPLHAYGSTLILLFLKKRGCSGTLYAICRFILPCCTGGISCSMNTPSKSCDTRQKTSGC